MKCSKAAVGSTVVGSLGPWEKQSFAVWSNALWCSLSGDTAHDCSGARQEGDLWLRPSPVGGEGNGRTDACIRTYCCAARKERIDILELPHSKICWRAGGACPVPVWCPLWGPPHSVAQDEGKTDNLNTQSFTVFSINLSCYQCNEE